MAAFLITEEGPLAGTLIRLEEGAEWIIGRDPDVCFYALEDPMVSRKHAILRLTEEGYVIENLSSINPASVNGKTVTEPLSLQEGDTVQIGNIFFRFTETDPGDMHSHQALEEIEDTPTIYEEAEDLEALAFNGGSDARWIIKVISGPNTGAEFGLHSDSSYTIGKDPNVSDFVFQDLTVSSKHAKITSLPDGVVTIEDLGSKNKVLINGLEIQEKTQLKTQDLVALGTTSFLIIDQENTRETIMSPLAGAENPFLQTDESKESKHEELGEKLVKKNWKQMIIPIHHIVIAAVFALFIIAALGSVYSLFKGKSITISTEDEMVQISKAMKNFPEVEYSFNASNGKLFILGHVMTEIDHQEMIYTLHSFSFIQSIEDNVIIDELVWENTNALIVKTAAWRGVSLTSLVPGHFILRGYVQKLEEAIKLSEYINLNFPYLDKLDNQVVVENTLEAHIQSVLAEKQFESVTFQLANGELILSGRVGSNMQKEFNETILILKKMKGIRLVKNFVVFTAPTNQMIDLSSKYKVTGSSKYGKVNQYIVINGKILSKGDTLDGMDITHIDQNTIFLEKDGVKYKINYNQQ